MWKRFSYLPLILSIALFAAVGSQKGGYIESNYIKREYRIPMRDGKKLFTAVYSPKDTSQSYPIMLTRTPYGIAPYGPDEYPSYLGPSEELARDKYIFAYQDVRGRMMSEGEFINMTPHKLEKKGPRDVDESSDAYDTIDWLVKNVPNNNGNVGIWGISYPGFFAAAGMIDAHPALKAVSPQAPIADWFIGDDFHHNGAFFLAHAFGFLASFGRARPEPTTTPESAFPFPTSDGYDFFLRAGPLRNLNEKYLKGKIAFWNEVMAHGRYDDFWQARNLRPHLKNIQPAVMTVGGWFDAEDLFGTLAVYKAVEESSPQAYNILVMGPWYHGAWAHSDGSSLGKLNFGSDTAAFYRKEIEFPFFRHHLKKSGRLRLTEATVFKTGGNEWVQYERWPPAKAHPRKLFFSAGGRLSWKADDGRGPDAYDEYISDPGKPVPYSMELASYMNREYMVEDQRFAACRPDVLTYVSDPLAEDITIAGPVGVSLNVSTTGTDSDFIVKVIDLYPDDVRESAGFQQLVRGEPFRGRFRNSFTHPEPFTPRQIAKIEYEMPDIFHAFLRGHRIMVQVQSSWFPLIDINPQQFIDISSAGPEDFMKATQRIYRSSENPSYIVLRQIR